MKNIHFLSISPKAILHLMNKTHSEKKHSLRILQIAFYYTSKGIDNDGI